MKEKLDPGRDRQENESDDNPEKKMKICVPVSDLCWYPILRHSGQ